SRVWVRRLALLALTLVIFQGVLGGQRVLRDDRRIAQLHGIVGPMFFAFATALAVWTSKWWIETHATLRGQRGNEFSKYRGLAIVCWFTVLLAICQLVLGSFLRHGIEYVAASAFRSAVLFHVVVAGLLMLQSLWMAWRLRKTKREDRLRRPAAWIALFVVGQITLGVLSWAVKYGWPTILEPWYSQPGFLVQSKSMVQSLIVTGHVALGALILAVSVMVSMRSSRIAWALAGEKETVKVDQSSPTMNSYVVGAN
ncbi:MAG: hypothetical protein AAF497_08730, partial [Planctomycetota bacterium]